MAFVYENTSYGSFSLICICHLFQKLHGSKIVRTSDIVNEVVEHGIKCKYIAVVGIDIVQDRRKSSQRRLQPSKEIFLLAPIYFVLISLPSDSTRKAFVIEPSEPFHHMFSQSLSATAFLSGNQKTLVSYPPKAQPPL